MLTKAWKVFKKKDRRENILCGCKKGEAMEGYFHYFFFFFITLYLFSLLKKQGNYFEETPKRKEGQAMYVFH